jgi:hypothetical protein
MKRARLVEADAESLIARLGDQAYFEARDRAQDEESLALSSAATNRAATPKVRRQPSKNIGF